MKMEIHLTKQHSVQIIDKHRERLREIKSDSTKIQGGLYEISFNI